MVLDSTREAQPGFPLCPYCLSHQEEKGKEQPWNRSEGKSEAPRAEWKAGVVQGEGSSRNVSEQNDLF